MSSVSLPSIEPRMTGRLCDRIDPHGWGFALLVFVTAILFVRPADLIPALDDLPIYQVVIIACIIVAARPILLRVRQAELIRQPVTACLLLMIVAVTLSHLAHGRIWHSRFFSWEFSKLVVLYLLVVSLLHTPKRLLVFVNGLSFAITFVALIALLDESNIISLTTIEAVEDSYSSTQSDLRLRRLRGTGIFEDPNDLGLIIVTGLVFCGFQISKEGFGLWRYLWGLPFTVLLVALGQTHSRGAFLSLLAVVPAWLIFRRGWKNALLGSLLSLPVLLLVFAGRMTDMSSVVEGTGQSRIRIWSDSLYVLKTNPLFGLGQGMFVEEIGLAGHNSFLQTYAELGVFGGSLFVGCFASAVMQLRSRSITEPLDFLGHDANNKRLVGDSLRAEGKGQDAAEGQRELAEVHRLRAFMFAAIVAYAVGLLTLSRQFVGPTYLLLGLATATSAITNVRLDKQWQMGGAFALRIILYGLLGLAAAYVAVKVLANF